MLQKPTNQPIQQQKIIEDDAKKRQKGTGFTNISKVLGANVGAGQRMGQAIGGQLGQQAEQIRKGIEQGQSQFQAGLQKEQQKQTETLGAASGALESIMGQQPGATNYEQIGQNLRNLQYSGPSSIENIQEQQQKASNLAALGRLSGITGGQQELLRSQVADRGRYGLGQSSLDTLLLGKEGQRQLQAARAQTAATESQAQQAEKLAQAQAQAASSAAEQGKLSTINKIQGQLGDIQKTATQQGEQFISDVNRLKELFKGTVTPNQVTPEDYLLLDRAENGEFGDIGKLKLYTGEEAALKNTLSAIGGAMNPTVGGYRYLDNQKQKASDLASLLSGSKAGQDILNSAYNEKVYAPTELQEKGIVGSSQEAFDRAVESTKQSDLSPSNRVRSRNYWDSPDYDAIRALDSNAMQVIDNIYDREAGKKDDKEEIELRYFNGTRLAPYAKRAAVRATGTDKNWGSKSFSRIQATNLIMQEIAKDRQDQINSTDYTKDPRITSQQKEVFGTLRSALGMPLQNKVSNPYTPTVRPTGKSRK